MTLKAGASNERYLTLRDLSGALLTGQVNTDFTKTAANDVDGNVASLLTVTEVDAVNHPGLYRVTINLATKTAELSWQVRIVNATTGFAFALSEIADTSAADTALARKALVNRLEVDPAGDTMKLYDDDDTLLLTHVVKDKDGATITGSTGVPSRRAKGI